MWPFGGLLTHIVPPAYQAVGASALVTSDFPTPATAILRYDFDGGCRLTESSSFGSNTVDLASWSPLHPSEPDGASWYVRFDGGAWQNLGVNRTHTVSRSSVGNTTASITVDISDDGSTVFDSATFSYNLTVDTP